MLHQLSVQMEYVRMQLYKEHQFKNVKIKAIAEDVINIALMYKRMMEMIL